MMTDSSHFFPWTDKKKLKDLYRSLFYSSDRWIQNWLTDSLDRCKKKSVSGKSRDHRTPTDERAISFFCWSIQFARVSVVLVFRNPRRTNILDVPGWDRRARAGWKHPLFNPGSIIRQRRMDVKTKYVIRVWVLMITLKVSSNMMRFHIYIERGERHHRTSKLDGIIVIDSIILLTCGRSRSI